VAAADLKRCLYKRWGDEELGSDKHFWALFPVGATQGHTFRGDMHVRVEVQFLDGTDWRI
jgi:hypothetical protein